MVLISTWRIIKNSFQDFFRNFWLSIITITILILSLFSINFLIAAGVISQTSIGMVEDKIDLSLYLDPEAAEEDIGILKSELEKINKVKRVEYISKTRAMETFQQKHKGNAYILESLRELGKNPLNPSFIIEAENLADYQEIISSLDNLRKNSIIESRDFEDHENVLARLNNITTRVRQAGVFTSGVFILITILVVFNAIRIAIYTHKKEIKIMKLVGAGNWFIRAPFLAEAIIYALIGVIGIIVIFYPFLHLLQPYLGAFFDADSLNLIEYFNANFIKIFGLQLLGAAFVNILASLLAVGRYLKV